jgi:four helix bundle protein
MSNYVTRFQDLDVYLVTRALAHEIFTITTAFPPEERYSLTDQWRRAVRAIGAAITEAWGKRQYVAHFVSKLTDADAEKCETIHWTEIAFDCAYIDAQCKRKVLQECERIGRMLGTMMERAESFCNPERRSSTKLEQTHDQLSASPRVATEH